MILQDLRTALLSLLTTDATFAAAVATLIGASAPVNAITSNRPLSEIAAGLIPAWVAEQGDAQADAGLDGSEGFFVMGLSQQSFKVMLPVSLVWQDTDRERAANARADIGPLLVQLMLRNPRPGGVDMAFVRSWQPDRAVNHPLQVWRAEIEATVTIYRG